MSLYNVTHQYCDADAFPAETTNASSLLRDEFYKICPGHYKYRNGTDVRLGQPRCGDGTNFSFFVSRPPKEAQDRQRDKILIELNGGGACWDATTCKRQSMFLSFPQEQLGQLVGSSCSAWTSRGNSMLCAKTVGDTDFSEYDVVLIPYCTQDVHLGDEPNSDYGVKHVGGHNLYQTLKWIFDNFPDPSHIFITGCSAGATPFPVVYEIINSHYVAHGKQVEINGIADSPVFLTPSYFLKNGLGHWNVKTVMDLIGFDYDTYKDDENFFNQVLDYALENSKETDRWGYVTHDSDRVSLLYYGFMNGDSEFSSEYGLGRRNPSGRSEPWNLRRQMTDDLQIQWWMKMNNSLSLAMKDHNNFHSFVMEGTRHCTFSLNIPLQYTGFEEWASMIAQENDTMIYSAKADNTYSSPSAQSHSFTSFDKVTSNASFPQTELLSTSATGEVSNKSSSSLDSSVGSSAIDPPIESATWGLPQHAASGFGSLLVLLSVRFLFHSR